MEGREIAENRCGAEIGRRRDCCVCLASLRLTFPVSRFQWMDFRLFGLLVGRCGGAVFGESGDLFVGVAIFFEHIGSVASELWAGLVFRLIVAHGERAADCYESADFSALVDLDEGVAVI